jgi:hypothetical protein
MFDVSSGTTGPWLNPTVVYVDRIWSNNRRLDDRFTDTSPTPPMVMSTNASTRLDGSTLARIAALPPSGG